MDKEFLIAEDQIDCTTFTFKYFDDLHQSIDELRKLAKRFEDISCYLGTALKEQKTLSLETAQEFLTAASDVNNDVHLLAHKILFKKRV